MCRPWADSDSPQPQSTPHPDPSIFQIRTCSSRRCAQFVCVLKGGVRKFLEGRTWVPCYHPQAGATCGNLAGQRPLSPKYNTQFCSIYNWALVIPTGTWTPWTLHREELLQVLSQPLMSLRNPFCNIWTHCFPDFACFLRNRRLRSLQKNRAHFLTGLFSAYFSLHWFTVTLEFRQWKM